MTLSEAAPLSAEIDLAPAKQFLQEKQTGDDRSNWFNTYLGKVEGDRVQVMARLPGNRPDRQEGWYSLTTGAYEPIAVTTGTDADMSVVVFANGSKASVRGTIQKVLGDQEEVA